MVAQQEFSSVAATDNATQPPDYPRDKEVYSLDKDPSQDSVKKDEDPYKGGDFMLTQVWKF